MLSESIWFRCITASPQAVWSLGFVKVGTNTT